MLTRVANLLTLWLAASSPAAETAIEAWVKRCPGGPPAFALVDGSNNIIVAGSGGNYGGGFVTIKYSASGSPLWTNRYDVTTNSLTSATGVTVDHNNDVVVTGRSRITGGDYQFDYATVKYSSAGVPLWTNRYNANAGPSSDDEATGVAVDSSNNVIVTGYSANASNYDAVTIKYSSGGLPLWTSRYDGPPQSEDKALAVAVDGNDNIIVTGYTGSPTNIFSDDFLTIKYSTAGVPLWTNIYNGPANSVDTAGFIFIDSSNNISVAGGSAANLGDPYHSDLVIVNYSAIGTPLLTNRYALCDGPAAMVVDGSNSVIIADSCGSNHVIIKYSNTGAPVWTNQYNSSPFATSGSYFQGVASDRSNNIAVAGFSRAGTNHFETIKYSSAGVPLWTNRYDKMGNYANQVQAVACDKSDDVVVVGYTSDTGQGPEGTTTFELVTIKYAVLGRPPVLRSSALTSSGFQMCVEGYSWPGKLVIEASSNLLQWLPVFTNSTITNLTFYSESDVVNHAARFYRAVQLP